MNLRHLILLLLSITTSLPAAEKLNVLFIVADDLRDTVGCYGNTSIKTPNRSKIQAPATR